MKKYILTLALGMACAMGFAQDYVIVNQGTTEHKYLLKEVTAISHTADAVTIEQGEARYTYPVVDVDSITFVDAQEQVMPDNPFDPYMPIYDGDTPPNIEGCYVISTHVLDYSNVSGDYVGKEFVDMYIKFSNQDMINNTVDFESVEFASGYSEHHYSLDSYVTGSGNNFTVFFNVYSERDDGITTSKRAYAFSGTVSESGIVNLYDGLYMQEKNDPYGYLIPVGSLRVFKDKDGMSPRTTWPGTTLKSNNIDSSLGTSGEK
jgi:hypothetical protein